jgi:hypothetical protein
VKPPKGGGGGGGEARFGGEAAPAGLDANGLEKAGDSNGLEKAGDGGDGAAAAFANWFVNAGVAGGGGLAGGGAALAANGFVNAGGVGGGGAGGGGAALANGFWNAGLGGAGAAASFLTTGLGGAGEGAAFLATVFAGLDAFTSSVALEPPKLNSPFFGCGGGGGGGLRPNCATIASARRAVGDTRQTECAGANVSASATAMSATDATRNRIIDADAISRERRCTVLIFRQNNFSGRWL